MTQTADSVAAPSEPLPPFVYGWLAFLTVVAVGIIYVVTSKYGPALSYDTGPYVAFTRNLLAGNGFLDAVGREVSLWPPGYAAVIALWVALSQQPPVVVMLGWSALLHGIAVLAAGFYLFRWLGYRSVFAWVGSFTIAIGMASQNMFVWALTEPQFIAAFIVLLVGMERYLATGKRRWWVVAILALWVATMTRYIGVTTLIPASGLALLLWERGAVARRFASAVLFGVVGGLPMGAWLIRNYLVVGDFTGTRPNTITPFLQHVRVAFRNIALWFAPLDPSHNAKQLIVGGIVLGILGLLTLATFALVWRRHRRIADFATPETRPMGVLWLYILVYLGVLIVLAEPTHLSSLEDRFLAPVFIPLMMVIFGMCHLLVTSLSTTRARQVAQVAVGAIVVWLVGFNLVAGGISAQAKLRDGAGGYNVTEWQENAVVNYLKTSFPADRVTYSNDNSVVYLFADQPTRFLPAVNNSNYAATGADWIQGHWPDEDSYVVWFSTLGPRSGMVTPDDLLPRVESETLFESEDGAVYLMRQLPQ